MVNVKLEQKPLRHENPNNRERLQLKLKLSLGIDNLICQFEDALCAFLRRDKSIHTG